MAKAVTHRPGRQHSLYVLSERIYSGKRCFYCGKLLRGSRTREHVFPLWLQMRFGLADQHLTLLNGTQIPYRHLTVPCCPTCNNVHLSKLEKRVQTLLFESPIAVARRDLKDIYIWANKILLGIVYAERLLPLNRRYPKGRHVEHIAHLARQDRTLMGLSSKPVFDDWDQTAYAHMLSFLTGYPVERLKPDDTDRVMTFISDAEGNPVNIPLRGSANRSPQRRPARH